MYAPQQRFHALTSHVVCAGIAACVMGVGAQAQNDETADTSSQSALAGFAVNTAEAFPNLTPETTAGLDGLARMDGVLAESGLGVVSDPHSDVFRRYAIRPTLTGRVAGVRRAGPDTEPQASRFVRQLAQNRRDAKREEAGLSLSRTQTLADTEVSLPASGGRSVDIQVVSRANVKVGDFLGEAAAGALVQVGQDLDLVNETGPRSGQWYFFISVDGGAVTWRPQSNLPGDPTGGWKYHDYVTVGEGQAGVAMRVGIADMALAYVYRDWSHRGYTAVEQYGGATVSFKF